METPPRLILASASPRRRELLALLGLPFEVAPSRYDEPAPTAPVDADAFVAELAAGKAREVALRPESAGALVLGSDTEVFLDDGPQGVPLGKPADPEDARRMLRQLAGRAHVVCTGVALLRAAPGGPPAELGRDAARTRVRFRDLTDRMIADYVATGEPLDKAGAYGAQGYAAPFIEGFEGDFFNVVGLPLCTVGLLLERAGIEWWRWREAMPPVTG